MDTKQKRLVMEIGVAVVAATALIAFVLLSQSPVTPRTPETNNPPGGGDNNTTNPPPGGGGTTPPPSGGGNNTTTPPPPPSPLGNGHKVPNGWAQASCPNLPDDAPAHGARSRCGQTATWGALKKAGLATSSDTSALVDGERSDLAGSLPSVHQSESKPGLHLGWAKQHA